MISPWRRALLAPIVVSLVACASSRSAERAPEEPGVKVHGQVIPSGSEPEGVIVQTEQVAPPLIILPAEADARVAMDKTLIVLDDGDTLAYDGVEMRFVGVDCPEIIHEAHGIYKDQPGGRDAAAFTRAQIEGAAVVEYLATGTDRYGRTLAHIFVDGEMLAVRLIRAGLAYETVTRYGDNGTPALSALIVEAAKDAPEPDFEDPQKWRRANQVR